MLFKNFAEKEQRYENIRFNKRKYYKKKNFPGEGSFRQKE